MSMWKATVTIRPKAGLRDPDGSTIQDALHALGWDDVDNVHVGRTIAFALSGTDEATVLGTVEDMCQKILANPVIEDYKISVASA